MSTKHQVAQPEGQAVHQHGPRGFSVQRIGEVDWYLYRMPPGIAASLMLGDTDAHLVIEGLGGGDVDPGSGMPGQAFLGVPAFA